ncbi:Hypothetical predicted protein [Octopus vulgaris]|uniref:Uncharacterized protein n=1 Tax=Octopus vulgaris TaxID=6645 RepID=A0AA36BQ29_OCTVU|nr:Hypothetical predicted protein [Octopus vulgaris]
MALVTKYCCQVNGVSLLTGGAKKDGIFSDLSNKVDSFIKGEEIPSNVGQPAAFNRNPPRNAPPQHPTAHGQQRPLGFPPIVPGSQPRGITPQQGFPPVLPDPKLARQQGIPTPRIGVPLGLKATPPPTTSLQSKPLDKVDISATRRDLKDPVSERNDVNIPHDEAQRDSLSESSQSRLASGQIKPGQKAGPQSQGQPGQYQQKTGERPTQKSAADRQRTSPSAEQTQRSSPTPAERQKLDRRGQRPGSSQSDRLGQGQKSTPPLTERQQQKSHSERQGQRSSPQPTERHSRSSPPQGQRAKPEPERRLSRSGQELSITERQGVRQGQEPIERFRDQRSGGEPIARRTSRGSQELTERHRSGQDLTDHRGQRISQDSIDRYGPKGQDILDRQRLEALDHTGRPIQRSQDPLDRHQRTTVDPSERHRISDSSDPHKISLGDSRGYSESIDRYSQRTTPAAQTRSGQDTSHRRSERSSPIPAQRRSQRSSPEPLQRRSQRLDQEHDITKSGSTLRSQKSTEFHSQRTIPDGADRHSHRLDRDSLDRYSQRSIDDSSDRYGLRGDREIERYNQRSIEESAARQGQRAAPPLSSRQRSSSDYYDQHSSPEPTDRPRVSRQTQRVADDPERSVLRSPSSEAEYYHSHRPAPPLPDKHTQKVAPEPTRRQSQRTDRESDYYRHRSDHGIAKPTPIPADRHRSAFKPIERPGRRSAPRLGEYSDRESTEHQQRTTASGRLSEPSERILRSPSSEDLEREMDEKRGGKFAPGRRRSSTVDEMLFDDYVEPPEDQAEAQTSEAAETASRRRTLMPMGDLISFDEEDQRRGYSERRHKPTAAKRKTDRRRLSPDSSDGGYGGEAGRHSSIDSSGDEFGGEPYHRSLSMESEQSWDSTYSIESQPDDITLECMEFMKMFVEKIFLLNEEISQTEKAKFGELCQHQPGRIWFARYVNSQRVHNKRVDEQIFFRLVQYFSVVLFECHMAEDYTPAKSLMNMCFTFFYENNVKYGLGPLTEDSTQTIAPILQDAATQTIETKPEYVEPTRFRDVGTVPRTPSVTKPITQDASTMTASVRTKDISITAKLLTHDIAVAADFKLPERPPVAQTIRKMEMSSKSVCHKRNTATSPVRFYEYMKPAVITHEVSVGPSLRTRTFGVGEYYFRTHEIGMQTDRDIPDIIEPSRRLLEETPLMNRLTVAAGRKRKSQSTDEVTKLELDTLVADKHRIEAETNLYKMEKKRIEAQLAYYGVDSQRVEAQKRYHQLKIKKLEREMALRE